MSYLRKGFRQSQFKNVIERNFVPSIEYYQPNENDLKTRTSFERKLDSVVNKNHFQKLYGNWIHFGSIKRNDILRNTDYTRNYNNCLDSKGKLMKMESPHGKDWTGWDLVPLSQVRNSKMFEIYGDENKIYHLTSLQHWNQIRVHGLINRHRNHTYHERGGRMYFVQSDDMKVLNYVGFGQVVGGLNNVPIVVLEIDKKGITGNLFGEDGNEFVTPLHLVLTDQKRIKPEFIKYHKTFHSNILNYYKDRELFGRLKQDYISQLNNLDKNDVTMMGIDFDVEKSLFDSKLNNRRSTLTVSDQSSSKVRINRSRIPNKNRTRKTEYKLVS